MVPAQLIKDVSGWVVEIRQIPMALPGPLLSLSGIAHAVHGWLGRHYSGRSLEEHGANGVHCSPRNRRQASRGFLVAWWLSLSSCVAFFLAFYLGWFWDIAIPLVQKTKQQTMMYIHNDCHDVATVAWQPCTHLKKLGACSLLCDCTRAHGIFQRTHCRKGQDPVSFHMLAWAWTRNDKDTFLSISLCQNLPAWPAHPNR